MLIEGHFEPSLTLCVRPRCPACHAPNPDGLETCTACGSPSAETRTIEVPALIEPSFLARVKSMIGG